MNITIRSAVPNDVDAVLALMRELAEHEGLAQYFELTAESLRRFCFESPARLALIVASADDVVVGYASYLVQFSPWMARDYLFLDDLYVTEPMRGRGVGALLMQRIAEVARQRDLDVRWHVEHVNASAQRFYSSLGAELHSRLVAYWSRETIRAAADPGAPIPAPGGPRP